MKDRSLKIDDTSDSDEEEKADHVNNARRRTKKDIVATGGEALDKSKEL